MEVLSIRTSGRWSKSVKSVAKEQLIVYKYHLKNPLKIIELR